MAVDGWLAPGTARVLATYLNKETRVAVELGSWKGLSALFIAGAAPNAVVHCIDTWQGSPEHQVRQDLGTVYEEFQANTRPHADRIHAHRATTLEGMAGIHAMGVKPDLVYVDAAHDYGSVLEDIQTARRLFPEAQVVGDDYRWPTVRRAVHAYARQHGLTVEVNGNGWALHPKARLHHAALWLLARLKLGIEQLLDPWRPPVGF